MIQIRDERDEREETEEREEREERALGKRKEEKSFLQPDPTHVTDNRREEKQK